MQIEDCYELGHVTSTHGTSGEVVVHLDVDNKDEYGGLESVFLERKKGQLVPYFIERFRFNKEKALVKFEDVETMEAAELLKNCRLYLPLDQLPKLEEGQFYFHQVIGYGITDIHMGQLGTVADFYDMDRQSVMSMTYLGKEVLIPLNDDIVLAADHQAKVMKVNLPEGLIEIYMSDAKDTQKKDDGAE